MIRYDEQAMLTLPNLLFSMPPPCNHVIFYTLVESPLQAESIEIYCRKSVNYGCECRIIADKVSYLTADPFF